MEEKDFFTLEETAKILDLSYQTILRLAQKGYLCAVKHGGKWRVTQREIARFKNEGNYIGDFDIVEVEQEDTVDIS